GGLALLEHGNQLGTQGVPKRINERFGLFFVGLDLRQPGLELLQRFRSRAWKDLRPAFALLRQPKDRSSRVFETASVVDLHFLAGSDRKERITFEAKLVLWPNWFCVELVVWRNGMPRPAIQRPLLQFRRIRQTTCERLP